MTKALFSDLDGTLLNDQKQITPGNRAAIEKMIDAGHLFIVATGRPLTSALQQAAQLGLDGPGCCLIAFNGGILYDLGKHEVISRCAIPLPVVRRAFSLAKQMGVYIQTFSEKNVVIENGSSEETAARYCGRIQMQYDVIRSIDDLDREPEKMLAIDYRDRTRLDPFREELLRQEGETLDAFYSCREYLEIVRRGLSKGNALRQMADLLGIPIENTVAAGDAENDLAMLQAAGTGAAMANSVPEVLAAADYITTRDNNHDGVAEIIERLIL